ncbi:MAG: DUF3352 domain-containing protein [Chloroflexota bacterium]
MTDHLEPNDETRTDWSVPAPSSFIEDQPHDGATSVAPVIPPSPPRRRPRRLRWLVAGIIVSLIVAGSAAAAVLLTGRAPDAAVLGYVPGDSVVYGELRLDLPGDQKLKLAGFLSKFPGFADQSTLPTKLNETLDRVLSDATNGKVVYSRDLAPWFGGQLAFSVPTLPDPTSLGTSPGTSQPRPPARALALASVTNATAADAYFDGLEATSTQAHRTETYGGTEITTEVAETGRTTGAYAIIDGKVAAIGDLESVKAAIDTHGASAFGREGNAALAFEATTSDHVGYLYVDGHAYSAWLQRLAASSKDATASAAIPDLTGFLPDWLALDLRFENDAVVVDSVAAQPTKLPPVGPDRHSALADSVPASTVALAEYHDAGKVVDQLVQVYRSNPQTKSAVEDLEKQAAILGGIAGLTSWAGDTGVAVTIDGATVRGGLVAIPADRAAADRLATSIRGGLTFVGGSSGISVREEPYAGTTITLVDVKTGSLVGAMLPEGSGTTPSPAMGAIPDTITIAYAVTDRAVVVGLGDEFVKSVLDVQPGSTSLAAQQHFKDALAKVGETNQSLLFVDLGALRGYVEREHASALKPGYQTDVQPYLLPFDALVAANHSDGTTNTSKLAITVK